MLPLRDVVAFPGMVLPLFVGRAKSINALDAVDNQIFLVTQHDSNVDEPGMDDLYSIGVIARIKQSIILPDKSVKILVEGLQRATLTDIIEIKHTDGVDHFVCELEPIEMDQVETTSEDIAL